MIEVLSPSHFNFLGLASAIVFFSKRVFYSVTSVLLLPTRVFSEPLFVFGRMILSTSLKHLLGSLPVVFSGLQLPRTIAIELIAV